MKKTRILAAVTALATLFAGTIATSACFWYFYQPEEPKCLNDR
ncbi:cyclic lactone autoinducer peptide [Parasporobacterium paucivorans]|uniref:Cyclic lactone autoinducer peptide n=1 Tax=Parasporobacterium paucivorans DSM 15970 TaxID=1122934 RepID=A0A1M6GF56_9FIRM|nr:cyclic lactone autoinducer peptide [Parasporobacterium paucivorans]SHJ08604.1 cyclic lactone autoinducer peptide [Parasporobacterium paucivorans DSM 15970]